MLLKIILVIAAYLLGSIPGAVLIGKRFYGIDIREHGSRNAGATNVLRVLGRKAAIPVLIIDMSKGFAAVMLFYFASFDSIQGIFCFKIVLAAAVVLGHIFPAFAGFRGGKGVATMTGAVLGIYPPAVLLCMATFFIVLLLTNYVSLSSMISGIMFPVYTVLVFRQISPPIVIFACVISVIIIITHRKNIGRLLRGTESKIYLRKRRQRK